MADLSFVLMHEVLHNNIQENVRWMLDGGDCARVAGAVTGTRLLFLALTGVNCSAMVTQPHQTVSVGAVATSAALLVAAYASFLEFFDERGPDRSSG